MSLTVKSALISAYLYILFFVCFISTLLSQLLVWILLAPVLACYPRLRYALPGSCLRFWTTMGSIWLNPFWSLKIVRPPPANYAPKKTIIMFNHLSGADPFISAAALFPWEAKYIYKADLHKVPLAGWCLQLARDIPVYFKSKTSWGTAPGAVQAMMTRVKFYHDLGLPTCVFPEGTRSRTGQLQSFRNGFFRYAVDSGIEVLPCVMHNTRALWPGKWMSSGTGYVAFGDPLVPEEDETAADFRDRVRGAMIKLLEQCPLFDPAKETPLPQDMLPERGHGIIEAAAPVTDSVESSSAMDAQKLVEDRTSGLDATQPLLTS